MEEKKERSMAKNAAFQLTAGGSAGIIKSSLLSSGPGVSVTVPYIINQASPAGTFGLRFGLISTGNWDF